LKEAGQTLCQQAEHERVVDRQHALQHDEHADDEQVTQFESLAEQERGGR
jgi:hypothetical protein